MELHSHIWTSIRITFLQPGIRLLHLEQHFSKYFSLTLALTSNLLAFGLHGTISREQWAGTCKCIGGSFEKPAQWTQVYSCCQ